MIPSYEACFSNREKQISSDSALLEGQEGGKKESKKIVTKMYSFAEDWLKDLEVIETAQRSLGSIFKVI